VASARNSISSISALDRLAVAFEQRLLLHRVEVEILRQGVDEILVRHVPRHHRLSAGCLEPIGQQRFELDTR